MKIRVLVLAALFTIGGCGDSSVESVDNQADAVVEDAPQAEDLTAATPPPVGLSLFFLNGSIAPITLVGTAPRYLQEIDIVASTTTTTDQGITPIITSGELSSLNWTGVTQVEEQWTPADDGTLTRERFYRGAQWMEDGSTFTLTAKNAAGSVVGLPIVAEAGTDNAIASTDDGWVRRFAAQQVTTGCTAVGNCTGATSYTARGLVQLRDALRSSTRARAIPTTATKLSLVWSKQPTAPRNVNVTSIARCNSPYGYGFQISLAAVTPPGASGYYLPGSAVTFRVTFRDGEGNRLHPVGSLPTYGQFLAGGITSGLRYLDLQLPTSKLYYGLKHREAALMTTLSGPTHKLKVPQTVVDVYSFFDPQVTFASPVPDGYTSVLQMVPPAAIIFGGFGDPTLWNTPTSDQFTFTIPTSAESGTYVLALKARRDFGGEALNQAATLDIQIGQAATTSFVAKTACNTCHSSSSASSFSRILHGMSDRRTCFSCHSELGNEADAVLDTRVHTIHDRSDRFTADINTCSNCHLVPPTGPARGLL